MTNKTRKHGFPVLAYCPPISTSPCRCTLLFKHSDTRKQATICLAFPPSLYGFDDEQTFIFQYDADNLVHGTTSLGPAAIDLPRARLDYIGRRAAIQMRTLSLRLKTTCPIWCPSSLKLTAPEPDFDAPFRQLVTLAKATEVHILFDYNWLHKDQQQPLQRLISHRDQLTGFPTKERYPQHNLADWTIFSPDDAVEAPPSQTDALPSHADACSKLPGLPPSSPSLNRVLDEFHTQSHVPASPVKRASGANNDKRPEGVRAPPSYADACNKRHATSSPSSSPPLKRLLEEFQTQSHVPASPTERASSDGELSPKLLRDNLNAFDFQAAINHTVASYLPIALEKALPGILPKLFTVTPTSPSLNLSVSGSPPTFQPPVQLTGSLGALLATHLQPHLTSIYNFTLSDASAIRESLDADFVESLEDAKADLLLIKDDSVEHVRREGIVALDECREKAEQLVEDIEWKVWEAGEGAFENVQKRLRKLEKDKESFRREKRRGRQRGKGGFRGVGSR